MFKSLVTIFILLLISCSGSEVSNNSEDFIIISKRDSLIKSDTTGRFAPTPIYTGFTFVIDRQLNTYFHTINLASCSHIDVPPLIGLEVDDLRFIKNDEKVDFLDSLKELEYYKSWKFIELAFESDSASLEFLKGFKNELTIDDKVCWTIRGATVEELKVLRDLKDSI